MVLIQKWPFFQLFVFRQYKRGQCLLRYSRTKNCFLGYKNKNFKKSKNCHFSKAPKNGYFSNFFFQQYRAGKYFLRYSRTKRRLSCFYSLERRFFVLEYHKRHFPGLYCLKKKLGKMAIFRPKPWVNPFGNMSVFLTFWASCFYSLERRFFVLEYSKRHFSGLYCLKNNWENSHF